MLALRKLQKIAIESDGSTDWWPSKLIKIVNIVVMFCTNSCNFEEANR